MVAPTSRDFFLRTQNAAAPQQILESWQSGCPDKSGFYSANSKCGSAATFIGELAEWLPRQVGISFCELKMRQRRNKYWRAGRVVECGGLENRYIFTGIRGSNPWLSAKNET